MSGVDWDAKLSGLMGAARAKAAKDERRCLAAKGWVVCGMGSTGRALARELRARGAFNEPAESRRRCR